VHITLHGRYIASGYMHVQAAYARSYIQNTFRTLTLSIHCACVYCKCVGYTTQQGAVSTSNGKSGRIDKRCELVVSWCCEHGKHDQLYCFSSARTLSLCFYTLTGELKHIYFHLLLQLVLPAVTVAVLALACI
jgi:hypothetical protein